MRHMPTRAELHQLIDSLPDDAIPAAHVGLTQLQTWPPPIPPEVEARAEAMERHFRERTEMFHAEHPGSMGGGIGEVTFSTEPGSQIRGRHSFSYTEGADEVQESTIVHDGTEFTLIERIRRDQIGGAISFIIELTGPDGTTSRYEHRYESAQ
jgi:hypothetical protein